MGHKDDHGSLYRLRYKQTLRRVSVREGNDLSSTVISQGGAEEGGQLSFRQHVTSVMVHETVLLQGVLMKKDHTHSLKPVQSLRSNTDPPMTRLTTQLASLPQRI